MTECRPLVWKDTELTMEAAIVKKGSAEVWISGPAFHCDLQI